MMEFPSTHKIKVSNVTTKINSRKYSRWLTHVLPTTYKRTKLQKHPTIVIRSLVNMAAQARSVDNVGYGCNLPNWIFDHVGLGWGWLGWAGLGWDQHILNNIDVASAPWLVTSIACGTCHCRSSILLGWFRLVHQRFTWPFDGVAF